jgi:hypothetical protein
MTRIYTVTQRDAALKVLTRTQHAGAAEAMTNWCTLLLVAGHSPDAVGSLMETWTQVLMAGGQGYEVLDPDLQGSVSIWITTQEKVKDVASQKAS